MDIIILLNEVKENLLTMNFKSLQKYGNCKIEPNENSS